MALCDPKVVKISRISKKTPYCFRYRLQDNALKISVKRSGILMSVVVTPGERPVVIAGHKRLWAAQALKLKEVPVFVAEKMEPQDAFLLNLVSNWKQGFSDIDRARALGMAARNFHFKEREILSVVMPLLGLSEDKAVLELYQRVDQFTPAFKDFVEDSELSLRGVLPFLKFSRDDQDYFAKNIGARMKLTSSQLFQAGEWLADVMKGTGKCLWKLCKEKKILSRLNTQGMDPRTKADRFFAHIKRLRFPRYSLYLEEFVTRRSKVLRDAKELRLEPVQGFEEPGFELHARVKTPAELDSLLRKLSSKRSLLNSLFEIVL
ncbi:MAG: ParB N-terminal domain-containing protein [Candidatus Omnitrophica bacterium]|nr:ParB N-terminal domain-containing protein [Candidatus Omnitrophota bacterium]